MKRKFNGETFRYYSGFFQKKEAELSKSLLIARGFKARILKTDNGIDRPYTVYYRES